MKHFVCERCGNLVALLHGDGKRISCCERPISEITPRLGGEGKEKHTPVIHVNGDEVRVTVGPEGGMHPMESRHAIAWICLITSGGNQRKMLDPDGNAEAVFKLAEGERVVRAFAYCNLHGLWVAECKIC